MKTIEDLAIAFVTARRAKLDALAARNLATTRVYPDGDPLPFEEWCPHCQDSKRFHEQYLRWSRVASGALRALEKAVRRQTVSVQYWADAAHAAQVEEAGRVVAMGETMRRILEEKPS